MHLSYRSTVSMLLLIVALLTIVGLFLAFGGFRSSTTHAAGSSFIGQFNKINQVASTVPGNGDVNPYGVFVVPRSIGKLVKDDVLVSNFNNKANLQGTGTTIVQISRGGKQSLFAQIDPKNLHGACPGGVGLTTALVVLQRGWVIVGSLPTRDGMSATAKAGCLIVLDSNGHPVETFSGSGINGPWDMTASDSGNSAQLFVTNVLNGTVAANGKVVNRGTILRIRLNVPQQGSGVPTIKAITTIGSGFSERTDPAALVVGPTGVGLARNDTLYVADSVNSRIAAITNASTRQTSALTGKTVTANHAVNDPLGLTIAPNGDILSVNGGDGNIVETTPSGTQASKTLIPNGAGALFGLAVVPGGRGVYFVDDNANVLRVLH